MFFGLFWGDWTILIVIPGILFTLWAQIRVKTAYRKGASMPLYNGMTGASVARRILDSNGLSHIPVQVIPGELTAHYAPRSKTLSLSEAVYHGNNVAAVGVAAHEAGHALQDAKGYVPLRFRIAIVPMCNIGSTLAMPIFIIGLIFSSLAYVGDYLMFAGIALFSLTVFFQLVTLPVEFNASRRAMRCLSGSGTMSKEELRGVRSVLTAAALTYVAALAVGLLSLLRLLVIAGAGRSRRR